jgi:hypothetical protein
MGAEQFEAFRSVVFDSRELQAQLSAEADVQRFVALVVRLGAAHGHRFTEHDVQKAMAANRRAWIERRIL